MSLSLLSLFNKQVLFLSFPAVVFRRSQFNLQKVAYLDLFSKLIPKHLYSQNLTAQMLQCGRDLRY